jgi:HEAT repeat protein
MLLGKAAGKEASALLRKAAATDKDPGVRKAAGMWLGGEGF